ncbi:MAG: TerB family tellurite resistance protein [Bacteroidetes bacterium]|nr:TerB family tellurite resistance protein [Bacteroidota bacterium]MBV6459953.1 hypothetical protein [Flavobacteriales bacterium]WKZ76402.1 MAG: hypothetical protein QY303_05770 [Vicingaceae bacterium]MCL4816323.1 TerB family tellurite resistance protein [Flavobacteriales bacterium]NOG95349.1 TerB family tellurite resistance protein [Bacteroidota bacterium]
MKYTFEKNIIMDALQRIYYAIGLLAYSVAKADGEIQKEEKERLQNILLEEFKNGYADTDISEIIFEILRKDKQNYETAYNWAINELKVCSHKLTPEIKLHLLAVMNKVAKAFPPVTYNEEVVMNKLETDIQKL